MAGAFNFREGETAVDEALGYPRAYAKLCNGNNLYKLGPPNQLHPYSLQPHEAAKIEDFERLFPMVDSQKNPNVEIEPFVDLLWKQLTHLTNAGFDPALFRVDPYGNVLYFHADPSSPLSWRVDHWFPLKRGGKTVLSNLRLVQKQVYKAKKNKLEFLVPWWDLQLGISVNQFLSIFASRNSDFRKRAFSFLFTEREDDLLRKFEALGTPFSKQFLEKKRQVGLAPAAITSTRNYSEGTVLKSMNSWRQIRPPWPTSPSRAKENDNPNICSNEYLSIAKARDSLKGMEEAKRKQAIIREMDEEASDLSKKNDAERIVLQDLELALIRKRRRVEKCRRLAEAQASYRSQLEKMIRDAMHQCVVYKEQSRLNQAACGALVARLEAQKAMCDTSEKELMRREKLREEFEMQTTQRLARKRPWEEEEEGPKQETEEGEEEEEEEEDERKIRSALRKELRVFLEEEQKASQAGLSFNEDMLMETNEGEENEDKTSELGRRNVEKWLQILLEKNELNNNPDKDVEEEIHQRNSVVEDPLRRKKFRLAPAEEKEKREVGEKESCRSLPEKRKEKRVMIARPDSPRSSRTSFADTPLILKKGIDCIIKKAIRRT
ncbi:trichohyalin [Wolffia australiana]